MFLVLLLINDNIIGSILFSGIFILVTGYYFKVPKYLIIYILGAIGFYVVTSFILPSIGINLFSEFIFIDRYRGLLYANMYTFLIILIFEILEYPKEILVKIDKDDLFRDRKSVV